MYVVIPCSASDQLDQLFERLVASEVLLLYVMLELVQSLQESAHHVQVRWWDVTQGQQVRRLKGHTDYVRAAAVHPLDANTWATGAECVQPSCTGSEPEDTVHTSLFRSATKNEAALVSWTHGYLVSGMASHCCAGPRCK
jgi:hypothetical protein